MTDTMAAWRRSSLLKQNKLVWAGQSETTNPDSLHQFMRDLVKAIGADMRRKGVIAEPAS